MKMIIWILILFATVGAKAQTTPIFNGKQLIDVSTMATWNFAARPAGWYRIARIPGGNRGNATFELRENAAHSTLRFEVGVNYNSATGSSFTLTNHSYWSAPIFLKLRLITADTYSDVFLEVFVDPHSNDNQKFCAYLINPLADGEWELVNWQPGSIPSGYSSFEYDANKLFTVGNNYNSNILSVHRNGNVGIGTSTPSSKLSVNGTIRAREIKVENAAWPDYVFEKGYQLPSLEASALHIKSKGHLPDIPSADEVKANGIDLGEMNAKLLQKIEELTLHLININRTVQKQQLQIEKLQKP